MEERLTQLHKALRYCGRLRQRALADEDQQQVARCEDFLIHLERQLAVLEGHAVDQTLAPADPQNVPFRRPRMNH